jgi:hypothetical protein
MTVPSRSKSATRADATGAPCVPCSSVALSFVEGCHLKGASAAGAGRVKMDGTVRGCQNTGKCSGQTILRLGALEGAYAEDEDSSRARFMVPTGMVRLRERRRRMG